MKLFQIEPFSLVEDSAEDSAAAAARSKQLTRVSSIKHVHHNLI